MTNYFGVIGERDYIKYNGARRPFWHFLDEQPHGWLTSLIYARNDIPTDKTVIFDCGAWSYRNLTTPKVKNELVTAQWAYTRYQRLAHRGDILIAPDHMFLPDSNLTQRRTYNAASAIDFLQIVDTTQFYPMAVVHGDNLDERVATATKYYEMGYRYLAVGGVAALATKVERVTEIVKCIRLALPGVWLHVLGLSSPGYMARWQTLGVDSCDGSSHFKKAFTAGIFFEYNTNAAGYLKSYIASRPQESTAIEPCYCKACTDLRAIDIDTRFYGSSANNMGRAAHNLNMLMKAQKYAQSSSGILC